MSPAEAVGSLRGQCLERRTKCKASRSAPVAGDDGRLPRPARRAGRDRACRGQPARPERGRPVAVKNGAVTNPKLRNNAVNSSKVANQSLLRSDFAPGQLPAGPTGPQGPVGPAGARAGGAGRPDRRDHGALHTAIRDTTATDVRHRTEQRDCDSSGERAISAGPLGRRQRPGARGRAGLTPVTELGELRSVGFRARRAHDERRGTRTSRRKAPSARPVATDPHS